MNIQELYYVSASSSVLLVKPDKTTDLWFSSSVFIDSGSNQFLIKSGSNTLVELPIENTNLFNYEYPFINNPTETTSSYSYIDYVFDISFNSGASVEDPQNYGFNIFSITDSTYVISSSLYSTFGSVGIQYPKSCSFFVDKVGISVDNYSSSLYILDNTNSTSSFSYVFTESNYNTFTSHSFSLMSNHQYTTTFKIEIFDIV